MDIIYLHGLKLECVIGVWEWERRITQTLVIDLEMASDIKRAAATDALEDTLNYKAVAKRLIGYAKDSQFKLIESFAEAVANILVEEFAVPWCRVTVNKVGAIRGARDVGVIIERGESG
ncbi:MAG: dihydroneopterin aldolase [Gammaproteobacteria bacterium]|nr:dihydroneopterin aldolase [Gammaproteobacteria bacterium]